MFTCAHTEVCDLTSYTFDTPLKYTVYVSVKKGLGEKEMRVV